MNIKVCRAAVIAGLAAMLVASAAPARVSAAVKESWLASGWPEKSRDSAREMIDRHGMPNKLDGESMTWYGLYRGRRTVLQRASGVIQQVVIYSVPAGKVEALMSFNGDIVIDRPAGELSVFSDSVATNLLLLNLAHDIASGFISVETAKARYRSITVRADAGESMAYRRSIGFEAPLPSAQPR